MFRVLLILLAPSAGNESCLIQVNQRCNMFFGLFVLKYLSIISGHYISG